MKVSAYECTVVGHDWQTVVNHFTSGKAKAEYLRDVRDSWPDIKFTDIRVRRLGAPQNPHGFERCAEYRGVAFKCGDRVQVAECGHGFIVGHNSSANFDVLFDSGQTLNVHPASIRACAE